MPLAVLFRVRDFNSKVERQLCFHLNQQLPDIPLTSRHAYAGPIIANRKLAVEAAWWFVCCFSLPAWIMRTKDIAVPLTGVARLLLVIFDQRTFGGEGGPVLRKSEAGKGYLIDNDVSPPYSAAPNSGESNRFSRSHSSSMSSVSSGTGSRTTPKLRCSAVNISGKSAPITSGSQSP